MFSLSKIVIYTPGVLTVTWKNRKFQFENQSVCAIPFGKIWTVICGDAVFLLFLDFVVGRSPTKSNFKALYMFMHKISNRVVCLNCEIPSNTS